MELAEELQEDIEGQAEDDDGQGGHEEHVEVEEEDQAGSQAEHHASHNEHGQAHHLEGSPQDRRVGARHGLCVDTREVYHPQVVEVDHEDDQAGAEIKAGYESH